MASNTTITWGRDPDWVNHPIIASWPQRLVQVGYTQLKKKTSWGLSRANRDASLPLWIWGRKGKSPELPVAMLLAVWRTTIDARGEWRQHRECDRILSPCESLRSISPCQPFVTGPSKCGTRLAWNGFLMCATKGILANTGCHLEIPGQQMSFHQFPTPPHDIWFKEVT